MPCHPTPQKSQDCCTTIFGCGWVVWVQTKQLSDCMISCKLLLPCVPFHRNEMDDCHGQDQPWYCALSLSTPKISDCAALCGRGWVVRVQTKQCSDCMTSCMPLRPCVPSHPNEMDDCQGRDQPWHRAWPPWRLQPLQAGCNIYVSFPKAQHR